MVLEIVRSLVIKPKEVSDGERASRIVGRITNVFWLLANNPRASVKDGPSWEEITRGDLQILGERERNYLFGSEEAGVMPWVYAHTRENEGFIAIGLGARRVKFFVNGGTLHLVYETRRSVGVWQEGEGRDVSWEEAEKIVGFVEQVPQRRLLNGSSSSQIDGLPGTEV